MAVFHGLGGFFFGFVIPVLAGLYFCSESNLKLADFWLRVLFFWLVGNQFMAPFLKVVLHRVSPSFWSLVYTAYPLALMVPKSQLLKILDNYTVTFLNLDSLNHVKSQLKQVCRASRRALSNLYLKLQELTTF